MWTLVATIDDLSYTCVFEAHNYYPGSAVNN